MQPSDVLMPRMPKPRPKVLFAAVPVGWATRCLSLGEPSVRRCGPDFPGACNPCRQAALTRVLADWKTSPLPATRASSVAPVAGHGCRHAFLDLPGDSFQWTLSLTADHLTMMQRLIGVLSLHQTAPSLRLPAFLLSALLQVARSVPLLFWLPWSSHDNSFELVCSPLLVA
jgi:hypothetical protein